MKTINIAGRHVGNSHSCFLIAEVGQGHDGSLGMAHAYVDAAAEAGADAIKFQTHIASAESTLDEPFRVKFSLQDETRYAYWRRMEFTSEQWAGLANHSREKGLIFLSSPFSIEAVTLLANLGVPAWKVGSGEFFSRKLIDTMLKTGGAILLSTGMSRWDEIDSMVEFLSSRQAEFAVLQCTSKYPTPLPQVGLNVLEEMKRRYKCPVGLSDHSGTVWPALAVMASGCHIIEVHITFDRRMFGPDVPASVTLAELALIREARDCFFEMTQNPVDKNKMADEMTGMRTTFGKSMAPVRDLKSGTMLTKEMITFKKPATGILASSLGQVVGRRLVNDVTPDRLLNWNDLEK